MKDINFSRKWDGMNQNSKSNKAQEMNKPTGTLVGEGTSHAAGYAEVRASESTSVSLQSTSTLTTVSTPGNNCKEAGNDS